jgi:collagen triple helix repeat protein
MSKFKRFHERYGLPGVVIGLIALLVALGGTAYAAAGLTGKQKKEVTKIAKQYAGKAGAPGATGPAGPQGAQGAKGNAGANGSPGAQGSAGPTGPTGPTGPHGNNVIVTPVATGLGTCAGEGGIKVEVETISGSTTVCNGKKGATGDTGPQGPTGPTGSPWTGNSELPAGATITGTWDASTTGAGTAYGTISFPLKLPSVPTTIDFVPFLEPDATCTALNVNNPPVPPAHTLCVYEGESEHATFENITDATNEAVENVGRVGGMVVYSMSSAGFASGTYALTN